MGNNKLDNLFQEQLKNLEVSPNKRVWNTIETQLKKKKRRVFPIWWFTGVASSILILLSLFYTFSSDDNLNFNNNSDAIITESPEIKPIIKNKIDTLDSNKNIQNRILISKRDEIVKTKKRELTNSKSNRKETIDQFKKILSTINLTQAKINFNIDIPTQHLALSIPELENETQKISIADIVKDEETEKIKKTTNSWSVAPVFAVLKSNSFTDTSPINANLAESTSGENSYAYGVQIAYKLNNRWSVQSGIHFQEISYANNQIAVNVSSSRNPFATEFRNGDAFSFDLNTNSTINEASLLTNSFVANAVQLDTGNLLQNYGYVEIPLEVKYNLLNNNKLESNLVSGFSTLFLNKNEVILNTQTFSRNLEAANLNDINFSGNIGLDFNYFVNQKISINFNPMLKLQFNTFSNNANGFAPFNLGLYTGVEYKF